LPHIHTYPTFLFATNTVGGVQFNRAGAAKFVALSQSENREFTAIIDTPQCHVAEGKLTIPKHAMKIPCQYPGGDLQMCEETYMVLFHSLTFNPCLQAILS
jgi:hypothetical protein